MDSAGASTSCYRISVDYINEAKSDKIKVTLSSIIKLINEGKNVHSSDNSVKFMQYATVATQRNE